jgi:hypothetical protein
MELTDARAYLDVIKAEEQRRAQLLPDHPDAAYDRWFFYDAPFINELCIVFLVALRHHIERRLIFLAACAADGGRPITKEEFLARVKELSNLKASARWDEISGRLTPDRCAHYHVIEALRHLANAYKHDPSLEPDDRLLNHLGLDSNLRYASIPESGELQKRLGIIVGLPANTSYSDIATLFLERVQGFLDDVEARSAISAVKWGRVSMLDVAH